VEDRNFIEHGCNKSNDCDRLVSDRKRIIFFQLIDALQVENNFPLSNIIKFSWNNRHQGRVRVLARLDRVYAFQVLGPQNSRRV
jgi:hypothetical protein